MWIIQEEGVLMSDLSPNKVMARMKNGRPFEADCATPGDLVAMQKAGVRILCGGRWRRASNLRWEQFPVTVGDDADTGNGRVHKRVKGRNGARHKGDKEPPVRRRSFRKGTICPISRH